MKSSVFFLLRWSASNVEPLDIKIIIIIKMYKYYVVDDSRSEVTFQHTVHNISKLKDTSLSTPCFVRNLPWLVKDCLNSLAFYAFIASLNYKFVIQLIRYVFIRKGFHVIIADLTAVISQCRHHNRLAIHHVR